MSDEPPVLLWTIRYHKIQVQECTSLDSAAWSAEYISDSDEAAVLGAEASGPDGPTWHDRDSLFERVTAMERERRMTAPSPTPFVARIEISAPPWAGRQDSVTLDLYTSWEEAEEDYQSLRAAFGEDRVSLIRLASSGQPSNEGDET